MKEKILIVDDEPDNVDALERLFRKTYQVYKAISGKEALAILKENADIALILTDQRMPEMTGVQLLKKSIKTHPHSLRILLTGYTDVESIVGSINSGEVYRYLNKPWDPVDLTNTIDKAIEKFRLRQELVEKNEQLELALSELKTLDQAKTNFMILINHELKTPLTVISSFLDLLKESNLNEEQKMFTGRIDKSRQRLLTMVESSLELISAETGQIKINKKNVSLSKWSKELEADFNILNKNQESQLTLNIEDSKVSMDSSIIRKVLNKLMDNAIKFSTKGAEIQLLINDQEEGCEFKLTNPGPKLNKSTIQKILKPFSLDEDIMNHSKGLGLGLSTCQALLKAHDSELKLESNKDIISASFVLR